MSFLLRELSCVVLGRRTLGILIVLYNFAFKNDFEDIFVLVQEESDFFLSRRYAHTDPTSYGATISADARSGMAVGGSGVLGGLSQYSATLPPGSYATPPGSGVGSALAPQWNPLTAQTVLRQSPSSHPHLGSLPSHLSSEEGVTYGKVLIPPW